MYSSRRNTKGSLLNTYGDRLGHLIERRLTEAALLAAKQEAERHAERAQNAVLQMEVANAALSDEIAQRREVQAQLETLANHDTLTGLPNRLRFNEQLFQEMSKAQRGKDRFALMFLDLDRFKHVNDTLGHAVGDELLKQVAGRLADCLREGDMIARLGGDEFAILQPRLSETDGAGQLAQRLIAAMAKPFDIGGSQIFSSTSVGITLFPDDGEESEMLQLNADQAMYKAKQDGRNTYYFFDAALNENIHRRRTLERALQDALPLDQISVMFHPQIDLVSGRMIGVSALPEWVHPSLGHIPSEEFLPIAEQSGLITGIGSWLLLESSRQIATMNDASLTLSIKISATQFKAGDVCAVVADTLRQSGLAPSQLQVEIAEADLMIDLQNSPALAGLQSLGVQVVVGNFGKGTSSLDRLADLPIDAVKIHSSFIGQARDGNHAAKVIKSIGALAKSLNFRLMADGVETPEQALFLRSINGDAAQGPHYGRPLTIDDLSSLLRTLNNAPIHC